MITLITATGSRPQAFALCQKYMFRQTAKVPIRWVIVYDSEDPPELAKAPDNFKLFVVKGSKLWREGINTQRTNLDTAVDFLKRDRDFSYCFVIEDDDWYSPLYLEEMCFFLKRYPFVGQANSRYYNVAERSYREWRNYIHASLCETAFHSTQLSIFEEGVNSGDLFMDCSLWRIVKAKKIPHLLFDHLGLVCGIKGLPGRQGIGAGHHPDPSFSRDISYAKLREWVGEEDYKNYRDMVMEAYKK